MEALKERFAGIDFGDDVYGECKICGDYIWGNEVECGEAFFEAFDPRPPHHHRCLPEFMRTGKLLPHAMEYYQNNEKYLLSEGMTSEMVGRLNVSAAERGEPAKSPITWDEVVVFLTGRYIEFAPQVRSFTLSGSVDVPVFACCSHARPDILFPNLMLRESEITSDEEEALIKLTPKGKQPLDEYVAVVPCKTRDRQSVSREDLCEIGVVASLVTLDGDDGKRHMTVRAFERVKITWKDPNSTSFMATIKVLPEVKDLDFESSLVKDKIQRIQMVVNKLQTEAFPPEVVNYWSNLGMVIKAGNFGLLLDLFASSVGQGSMWEDDLFPYRMAVLDSPILSERLDAVYDLASYFDERVKVAKGVIEDHAKKQIEEQQKALIRSQVAEKQKEITILQKELGEGENEEVAQWEARLQELEALTPALPSRVVNEAQKQLKKIKRYKPDDQSYGKIAEWLENFFALGWDKRTPLNVDPVRVREVLDEDHYGLTQVKDRVVELMARFQKQEEHRKLVAEGKAEWREEHKRRTVLCFAGPPGVAKTSIAHSIARAIGAKIYTTSFGGVEDESEVHGFQETYVGSMPGQIIRGLAATGVKNPVFVIDEIDKIKKHRGNPEAAFLAVLDSTLSDGFVDKYVRAPFDLSEVLFICTANDLSNVMPALLDRMEVIEFSGYTAGEKLEIAKRHLAPKAVTSNFLPADATFTDEVLASVRDGWTQREAGVRKLNEQISKLCRKMLAQGLSTVTSDTLPTLLGPKAVLESPKMSAPEIGSVNGLAYSEAGGSVLAVEVELTRADKKFTTLGDQFSTTGGVQEVMKESILVALARVRKLTEDDSNPYGVTKEAFEKAHFHIHAAPLGVKKDGPSATVTIFTALVSALGGRPVDHTVAMTGEMTLRGKTLPVGGLAQKFSAAHREGIRKIVYPSALYETVQDLQEQNPELKEMNFYPVSTDLEVLKHALLKE